jgi:dUTP pyrophosphatase
MKIKIKKLYPDAVIPSYAKPGDAGMDLISARPHLWDVKESVFIYYTGVSIEIPNGFLGLVFPRSSISKYPLTLSNCVGVIDSGYRGEILVKFRKYENTYSKVYEVGDKIAQLIVLPFPEVEWEEVSELSDTERGDGGFGSTGK